MAAFAVLGVVAAPGDADAAKKRSSSVSITKPVDVAVPDAGPGAGDPAGSLVSTIDVGKRFKGRRIRDVNATVHTSGSSGPAASNLTAYLTAPNGATTALFSGLMGFDPANSPSIGPLTLDDESGPSLGSFDTAPVNPTALYQPWIGTAQPSLPGLYVMDNGPVKGTWRLQVVDEASGDTSVLNFWSLKIVTGKPYATK